MVSVSHVLMFTVSALIGNAVFVHKVNRSMLSLKILIALKILRLSFPPNGRFILCIQKQRPNCFMLASIFLFSCDKLFDLICFSKLTVYFA